MARQEGVIMLTGPIGNLSFYKMNGQYFARKKSGVSGDRIKSAPAYARTRENIAEFGQASRSAKLFRQTFPAFIGRMADCRVTGRLTAAMLHIVKSDAVNARGKRCVSDGETSLLNGFEFNKHTKLDERFKVQYNASIDRATGTMSIEVPAFVPSDMICPPTGATHFRLKAGAAAINFDKAEYSVDTCESEEIEITESQHEQLKLTMTLTSFPHPMFLVLGIEFLQRVNGVTLPLSERTNAMAIVNVDDGGIDEALPSTSDNSIQQKPALMPRSLIPREPLFPDRKPIPIHMHQVSIRKDQETLPDLLDLSCLRLTSRPIIQMPNPQSPES